MSPKIHQSLFAAALLALVGIANPAAAAEEPEPALNLSTEAIEANVVIEDPLKTHPGLADNLLAEGRRELAQWRIDAEAGRKDDPEFFRDGRRWTFERWYRFRSAIGRYVSIVRFDDSFAGGAHPNTVVNTILWDRDARKQVSIRPLFQETADNGPAMTALYTAISAALVKVKQERDIEVQDPATEFASLEPKLLGIGAVALAPSTEKNKASGLSIYFSPYAVGPYAEGRYTVFIPWQSFKTHLSTEGAALFGGERPADDNDLD